LSASALPNLHVCITCRANEAGEPPLGRQLHDALAASDTAALRLHEVSCLALCEQGCSAVIASPGKWSYLLGGLRPALAPDLIEYVRVYAASATGTVMPSRRPASLRHMIRGRVPAELPT